MLVDLPGEKHVYFARKFLMKKNALNGLKKRVAFGEVKRPMTLKLCFRLLQVLYEDFPVQHVLRNATEKYFSLFCVRFLTYYS